MNYEFYQWLHTLSRYQHTLSKAKMASLQKKVRLFFARRLPSSAPLTSPSRGCEVHGRGLNELYCVRRLWLATVFFFLPNKYAWVSPSAWHRYCHRRWWQQKCRQKKTKVLYSSERLKAFLLSSPNSFSSASNFAEDCSQFSSTASSSFCRSRSCSPNS